MAINRRWQASVGLAGVVLWGLAAVGQAGWAYRSSADGAMEPPNGGNQQTACLVLDIDQNGTDDFVIAERTQGPSVVWYARQGDGTWKRRVIETTPLHIEAGGDVFDIDGDGDLDIVFCGDWKDDGVWWWENPHPNHDGPEGWVRRTIKSGDGARYQHDCRFGDFDGDGRAELAWWSQTAKKLFLADIPTDPRRAKAWDCREIWSYTDGPGHEGMDVADVDGDGTVDIVGAGYWFKYAVGRFQAHLIAPRPSTRCAVGQIIPGGRPEVVLSPGDSDGPVEWYEWKDGAWAGHTLLRRAIHAHSLALRDINGDGRLDVFVAEMGSPGAGAKARTMIFRGLDRGRFAREIVAVGKANHESRLGDLDGDGDVDIIGKPYSYGAPGLHIWLQD